MEKKPDRLITLSASSVQRRANGKTSRVLTSEDAALWKEGIPNVVTDHPLGIGTPIQEM